ncbi:MAG: hypothetical protein EP311_08900 [Cytophagales bacterium]|uniref:3-oxoacyl-ACP synthase n=1 Tax=Algoriphagus taiwanensis TaxID=1445656 RepID=A0ABQ6PZY4_9BACT|nr:MAG: hypothetical protein EP311_08900 [Cytophagales bacterium]GMQ33166.1 hypothetical protein Ataiwa_14380 [Algoriphagus taiwanensis]
MTTTRIAKPSILHACIIKQQLTIDDFEKEVLSLRTEITDHSEIASQEHRGGAERNEMLVRMEKELTFLKNELRVLENIDPELEHNQVQLGAVVITDQRIFFISTSVELVEVNGHCLYGISTKAPIFASMRGKKTGDAFEHAGVRYLILDVY